MLSSTGFALSALLVVHATGAPLETEVTQFTFGVRSGSHLANIYSGLDCTGYTIISVKDFGCGGTCYRLDRASSVFIQQEDTGNPKPTVDLYTSNTCSGTPDHAGIYSGEHSGCTNANSQGIWGSAYLYYNCKHWQDKIRK